MKRINQILAAVPALLLLPPHRLAGVPSLNLAIAAPAAAVAAAVAGDNTHLSRTLNAENPQIIKPHEEAQEPHRPHRSHSNSKSRGSQPPALESVELVARWRGHPERRAADHRAVNPADHEIQITSLSKQEASNNLSKIRLLQGIEKKTVKLQGSEKAVVMDSCCENQSYSGVAENIVSPGVR
ncbi:hypothetical protein NL676_007167 [Syzygium grande]|nr:hypothetical protein NL676_007167 [Syzygium grande]